MQRGASWYKSERKTGHSHSSVPVKPEALTLPTHLEGFLGFPHPGRDQTDRKAEPLQEGFHFQDIHCSVISILNFLIILSLDFCFLCEFWGQQSLPWELTDRFLCLRGDLEHRPPTLGIMDGWGSSDTDVGIVKSTDYTSCDGFH